MWKSCKCIIYIIYIAFRNNVVYAGVWWHCGSGISEDVAGILPAPDWSLSRVLHRSVSGSFASNYPWNGLIASFNRSIALGSPPAVPVENKSLLGAVQSLLCRCLLKARWKPWKDGRLSCMDRGVIYIYLRASHVRGCRGWRQISVRACRLLFANQGLSGRVENANSKVDVRDSSIIQLSICLGRQTYHCKLVCRHRSARAEIRQRCACATNCWRRHWKVLTSSLQVCNSDVENASVFNKTASWRRNCNIHVPWPNHIHIVIERSCTRSNLFRKLFEIGSCLTCFKSSSLNDTPSLHGLPSPVPQLGEWGQWHCKWVIGDWCQEKEFLRICV